MYMHTYKSVYIYIYISVYIYLYILISRTFQDDHFALLNHETLRLATRALQKIFGIHPAKKRHPQGLTARGWD